MLIVKNNVLELSGSPFLMCPKEEPQLAGKKSPTQVTAHFCCIFTFGLDSENHNVKDGNIQLCKFPIAISWDNIHAPVCTGLSIDT